MREMLGLSCTQGYKIIDAVGPTRAVDGYYYIPITLLANDLFFRVAKPRSPIFTDPVVPVINMLSHFKSRWIMGGLLVWRKCSPFSICLHHLESTFTGIFLGNRRMYLKCNQIMYTKHSLVLHM